jgi:ABC-type bacteriocin/lantibiotic exporter with double-glycine peptidase domain
LLNKGIHLQTPQGGKISRPLYFVDGIKVAIRLLSVVAFSCIMLWACASGPPVLRQGDVVLEKVPFHPQEEYQCGPASLAGVLNYEGLLNISPREIAYDLFSKSARGTLNMDMALYAQKKGFFAWDYSGSLKDLREKIDAGYPLVVMVDYGFSLWQVNHFMVVVGYNKDVVIVNSGNKEHEVIGNDAFLKAWRRTDFWTLLIKKK